MEGASEDRPRNRIQFVGAGVEAVANRFKGNGPTASERIQNGQPTLPPSVLEKILQNLQLIAGGVDRKGAFMGVGRILEPNALLLGPLDLPSTRDRIPEDPAEPNEPLFVFFC